jgi:predicted N-formylglutamate amidohydrolase
MSNQYHEINVQIDALYAQLDAIVAAESYDPQWYEQVAEQQVSLMHDRDGLLAGILMEKYNTGNRPPIDYGRALELAQHANEQRDNRARGVI